MNWLAKAAAYKILSALPGDAAFCRFIQGRITKSLVPTSDRVSQTIEVGLSPGQLIPARTNESLQGKVFRRSGTA